MIDIHAHICSFENPELASAELAYRSNTEIKTFFSTGTPQEYQFSAQILGNQQTATISCFYITFGIHPWYADQWNPKEWIEFYKACPIIGEIGIDSVWCEVPLQRQKRILEDQLEIAADLKKPVILHTKGCEKQIAHIIKDYPYPILIHWYSGEQTDLFPYIDLGCFFTLGPDTKNGYNDSLLKNIPVDRLFLETDGLDAIYWAFDIRDDSERELSLIKQTLDASAEYAARNYHMTREALEKQLERNLTDLLTVDS